MTAAGGIFGAVRSSKRRAGVVAGVAVSLLAGLSGAPGCKKEKESLIIASLMAMDANGGNMKTMTIKVTKMPSNELVTQQFFDLPATGLSMTTPIQFGVYLPASATGQLSVTATAKPATGCDGYSGTKPARVTAGDSVSVMLVLGPGPVCGTTGMGGMGGTTGRGGAGGSAGTMGSGGTTGTAGTGGSTTGCGTTVGTRPAAAAPPSLNNCLEYNHYGTAVCDVANDINNPFVYDVAVSPDGTVLATAADEYDDTGTVRIWRMQGNTPVQCGPAYTGLGVPYVSFSPNGQYLAIGWRLGRHVDIYRVPLFSYVGEIMSAQNSIYGIGWSPDSQTVFTVDYDSNLSDGVLYADRPDGTAISQRAPLGVDPDVLAVSPIGSNGGATIVIGGYSGNAGVYTFSGSTISAPVLLPTAAAAAAWSVGFTADGQLVAVGTDDGMVRFWAAPFTSTVQSGSPILAATPGSVVTALSFAPGGTYVALGYDTEISVWNVTTRQAVSRHSVPLVSGGTQYVDSLTFSASGGAVMVGEDVCGKVLVCSD